MTLAQQVNETFIVAIKTMVYFIRFFSGKASKFVNNIYTLTNFTPRTTTSSAPYLSFNKIQLRSHLYNLLLFSDLDTIGWVRKPFELLHHCVTKKSLINYPSSLTLG